MTTAEKISVMQHHDDDGEVEYESKGVGNWGDISDPGWDWVMFSYRKKIRKILYEWVYETSSGLTIVSDTMTREADVYQYIGGANVISHKKTGRWYNPTTKEFGNDAT